MENNLSETILAQTLQGHKISFSQTKKGEIGVFLKRLTKTGSESHRYPVMYNDKKPLTNERLIEAIIELKKKLA